MKQELDNNGGDLEARFIAMLQNQINETENRELEELIASSPEIKSDFEATKAMWTSLEQIPTIDPSEEMRPNFYKTLSSFKSELEVENHGSKKSILERIKNIFTYRPAQNWAYGLLLLTVGCLLGYKVNNINQSSGPEKALVQKLSDEVESMKQVMMLSMLENPVATNRMKAVSYTEELNSVDQLVIDALLTTLNFDENINVRLVTLEALIQFADHPKVREGLVQSIGTQESPLVQVALADAMLELQETRSVKSLEKMLLDEDLNEFVKDKFELTIKELI